MLRIFSKKVGFKKYVHGMSDMSIIIGVHNVYYKVFNNLGSMELA